MRHSAVGVVSLFVIAGAFLTAAEPEQQLDPKAVEFFEARIRPVLIQHCYQCHSGEAQAKKKLRGGLFLDSRDGMRKGGDSGPALVAGKANDSLLVQALRQQGMKMPPAGKLPETVIADFARWVEMGAPDPRVGKTASSKRVIAIEAGKQYWAFKPFGTVTPPALPSPLPLSSSERGRGEGGVRTPVDQFVLARLQAGGLGYSPPANKERLIRRAYFDLWGLPPSPADIDAFVNDRAANAYERLIDRLLAGERYGERWARHWLDVVRFAESGGYEFDGDRAGAFHYRDFVIRSLNQDLPYDQFIRLQIAGDQLQPGDFWATAATGFLVAGPYPGQTTAKTQQIIRYDHLDDMIQTVGTGMLGLSLGCARCHEHKYDPVPQEDYYRLIACLSRTDSVAAKLDPNPEIYKKAKAEFDAAHAQLVAARDKFETEELPGRLKKWLQAEKAKPAPTWLLLDLVSSAGKTPVKKLDDRSISVSGKADKADTYAFVFQTYQKGITALRLEALTEKSLPGQGPGGGALGKFSLADISLSVTPLTAPKGAKPTPVKLTATHNPQGQLAWSSALAGKDQSAVFQTEGEVGFEGGTTLTVTLKFDNGALGRPRLALSTAARPVAVDGPAAPQQARELSVLLAAEQGQLTARNREPVVRSQRLSDPAVNKVYEGVEQHAKQAPQPKLLPAFVAGQRGGGDVYFLIRGEVDKRNGIARPGFIQVLMNSADQDQRWTKTAQGAKGPPPVEPRVALARWITDPEAGAGPLLARVIVNRLWQHHFGRGIVATPNDFGSQGQAPTHPELLDWLAAELVKNGWRLKPIHKLLMTSAVYLQGNEANPAGLKSDPQNRLWWRYPTRRLEAEVIRDSLLAVSGTLDLTMFGPGTLDENSPRRSVYLTVKRSRLIPLLQMFDAPEAIQSIGERPSTTVPTQALALLNSPFVRQRAEKLAQRIRPASPVELPAAIDNAYLTALGRRPTGTERERMPNFVQRQAESYGSAAKSMDMALTDCCQVLLSLNEFIYVD